MIKLSLLFTENIRRELWNLDGEIILLQNSGSIIDLRATQEQSDLESNDNGTATDEILQDTAKMLKPKIINICHT